MSSKSLSAVLEKRIRRLCLSDFPCGSGSWRETKDGPEGAETESRVALLDLLDCPRSPWWQDDYSWSPQAKELRRLAVIHPERLTAKFIYSFFTSFCIVNKNVSVIDGGLLRFRKLEKLDLSCNVISEVPAECLPSTLKILELRANCLSSLCSLTERPPPQLQYLGLSSNRLGSHEDISCLTGRYWPQLVTLELNDCEFQDQQALLNALSSLPSLKMLMLKGNPFTLLPSYPGLAVDCLPQLACLDTLWLFPEERSRFRGLASVRDVTTDVASVTVSLGRLRGIPDVLMSEMKTTSLVVPVSYRYFITYQFLCSSASDKTKLDSESQPDNTSTAHVPEADTDQQQTNQEQSKADTGAFMLHDETYTGFQHLSQHSTARLMWSKDMDFNDKQTYTVSSLGQLKKFLNEGLYLRLEEEKVLSCPAAFKKEGKPSRPEKEKKTKKETLQRPVTSAILGSAHVPLHSMVQGSQKVDVLCDFGLLQKKAKLEQSTKELIKSAQTMQETLEKLGQKEEQCATLTTESETVRSQLAATERKLKASDEKLEQFSKDKSKLENYISDMMKAIDDSSVQLTKMNDDLRQKERILEELQNQLAEVKERVAHLIEQLQQELSNKEQELKETKDAHQSQINSLQEKMANLETTLKQNELLLKDLKASKEKSLSEASELHMKELEVLQTHVEQLKSELSSSKDKTQDLEKMVSELQSYKEQNQVPKPCTSAPPRHDVTAVISESRGGQRQQAYKTEIIGGVVVHTPTQNESEEAEVKERKGNRPGVLRCGYCVKQGNVRKSWKRRFFTLNDNAVSYYKSETDKEPLRAISLRDIQKVHECLVKSGDLLLRDNLFEIITSSRTFYIQTDSPEDMRGWIRDIEGKIQEFRGPLRGGLFKRVSSVYQSHNASCASRQKSDDRRPPLMKSCSVAPGWQPWTPVPQCEPSIQDMENEDSAFSSLPTLPSLSSSSTSSSSTSSSSNSLSTPTPCPGTSQLPSTSGLGILTASADATGRRRHRSTPQPPSSCGFPYSLDEDGIRTSDV